MKKILSFIAVAMFSAVSAFAGTATWSGPTLQGMSLEDALTKSANGETVYLYNEEAHLFLTKGNYWGTRATCVYDATTGNGSNYADVAKLTDGSKQASGMECTITSTEDVTGAGTYSISISGNANYVTADDATGTYCTGVWVDGGTDRPYAGWVFTAVGNNCYEISYNDPAKPLSYEGNLCIAAQDGTISTNLNILKEDATYTNVMKTWKLVSAEDYAANIDAINAAIPAYYTELLGKVADEYSAASLTAAIAAFEEEFPDVAIPSIKAALNGTPADMDAAKELLATKKALLEYIAETENAYPGIDLSAQKAVAANDASTVEQMTESQASIAAVIEAYVLSNLDNASWSNPVEITSQLANIDFDTMTASPPTGWKQAFTSNGNVGSFSLNTWSTEADTTTIRTPFLETWVAKGNMLSNEIVYHDTIADMKPGAYKIVANMRAYNESGAESISGAFIFANYGRTALSTDNGANYFTFNGMLGLWNEANSTYAIVGNDGKLVFGEQIEDANFNWLASKNWKVYYLGSSDEAVVNAVNGTESTIAPYSDATVMTLSVKDAFNEAAQAYLSGTTAADIMEGMDKVSALKADAEANIEAWKAYQAEIDLCLSVMADGLEGPEAEALSDYLDGLSDDGGYPTFIEALEASTEAVNAETAKIAAMRKSAVENGLVAGSDATKYIVNASFAEGFKGWTNNSKGNTTAATGTFVGWTEYGYTGGDFLTVVENYDVTTVDIYQEIEGLPKGCYELSCQAFERPGGNGSYDGSESPKVFLYMNSARTPVQNIVKDGMPIDQAINGVNSLPGETYSGNWPYDYKVGNDDNAVYVPNSVQGASVAFTGGRYVQSAKGLVTDGKMKIGLTSDNKSVHWVLWSNFKLKFLGMDPEVVGPMLEEAIQNVNIDQVFDKDLKAEAIETLAKAQESIESGDGDAMVTYLDNVYDLTTRINASVSIFADLETAINDFQTNLENVEGGSDAARAEAANYLDEVVNNYQENYTDADAQAAMANFQKLLINVTISDATPETPADLTFMIVNPALDLGNSNGWTLGYESGTYSNLQYQSASYTGEAVIAGFIEAWKGSVALGDGAIYQVISGLPVGSYTLAADVVAVDQHNGNEAEGSFLFAQEGESTPYQTLVGTGDGAPQHFEVTFYKASADSDVTIGIRTEATTINWLGADNFTLYYLSADNLVPEGITTVTNSVAAPAAIFTLNGAKVAQMQKGINIVRLANGKVVKILK